jgi:general L-amino acid transport system permease protein
MSPRKMKNREEGRIPFWRDEKALRILTQVAFSAALGFFILWIVSNINDNYQRLGLRFSFGFLDDIVSFDIAEGIPFSPADSYGRAFFVGAVNTLRVSLIGIFLATLLGFLTGIARLSSNWLVSKIAGTYIEIIRNTPLLVQLFIWYFAVMAKLPGIEDPLLLPGPVYMSNRGIAGPWLNATGSFGTWLLFFIPALILFALLYLKRRKNIHETGRPPFNILWSVAAAAVIPAAAWFFLPESPLKTDLPVLTRTVKGIFQVEGGFTLTTMYMALLIGLVVYSGAYIAEVVRGGILAVPRGQTEAARAQGFTGAQVLRLIVVPQALRVIIPPLINQYLNLVKNSSLAIAIGFADLYAVSQTMLNQSGRTVEVFILIMGSYLVMSLLISLLMNIVNKRIQIKER